ncbi:helix-turn-helix domain-containing transcriptional regulator [Bradyrhizobium brasilense]|uniref:Transcriptional regulator n=1 Tax=Bradyrhizobium brasilense TaxID=1419277 RepID=A0ABY8JDF8_9BRAD|nr:hypothetical protein [Bradyrhizobium brasilense]WFU62475.1 hypothetical protein QA636_34070 [Bradyrhizobium brasilense]
MSQVAKAAGVTREGLYKTLGENGNPEFATILRGVGNPTYGRIGQIKRKKKALA